MRSFKKSPTLWLHRERGTARKLTIALLAGALAFSFVACGGGEEPHSSEPSAAVESPSPTAENPSSTTEDSSPTVEDPLSTASEKIVADEVDEAIAATESALADEAVTATTATEIHSFDVGEGLATFIDSGQTEIVIDGGYKQFGEPFANYIEQYVDGNIELVIATHSHADHVGGLTSLYDEYQVDKTIYGDKGESDQFRAFWEAANDEPNSSVINDEDMTIDFDDGLSLTVIETLDDDSNTNNNSVISLLDVNGTKVLVTGDAEGKVEKSLSGVIGDIDIYYVGHHGSETSNSQSFLEEIKPDLCIISSEGPAGQYENPNWYVMKRLLDFTPDIFATYISGNIIVSVKDDDISISADEADRLTLENYGGTKKAANGVDEVEAEEVTEEEAVNEEASSDVTVYITDSGEKYHVDGCRYLKKSKHGIALADAKKQGYEPCSVCHPPE